MKVLNFPGAKQSCQKVVNFAECKNEYVAQKLLGSKKNVGMNEAVSIIWRIMEIEEGVIADNTLLDLHNSSYDTKAEFNNCFIIHSK